MVNNSNYPVGIDFSWVAIDSGGRIGVFMTGGEGPIPKEVLGVGDFLVSCENELLKLEVTSKVDLVFNLPRPDDFVELAERGIYAYDWQDVHRNSDDKIFAYNLIAKPVTPRLVSSLGGVSFECMYFKDLNLGARLFKVEMSSSWLFFE